MGDNLQNTILRLTTVNSTDNPYLRNSTVNFLEELDAANRRFSLTLLPCMVYAGVLIVVGIVGNIWVVYVFGFRFKRGGAQNFLILMLAVFDLLSCTIGMPAEIVDMALHYKFDSAALCKTMRFVNTLTATSSICILIVIAIDRYRRIRKPLQSQITTRHARLSLIPVLATSLSFTAPTIYVYGLRTVDSGIPGIKGLDCTISDEAKLTSVPLIYNSLLFLAFVFLAICLIVMYWLILLGLKQHARTIRKASIGTLSTGHESLVEHASLNDEQSTASPKESSSDPGNQIYEFGELPSSSWKKTETTNEGGGIKSDESWKSTLSTGEMKLEGNTSFHNNEGPYKTGDVYCLSPVPENNELDVADNSHDLQNHRNVSPQRESFHSMINGIQNGKVVGNVSPLGVDCHVTLNAGSSSVTSLHTEHVNEGEETRRSSAIDCFGNEQSQRIGMLCFSETGSELRCCCSKDVEAKSACSLGPFSGDAAEAREAKECDNNTLYRGCRKCETDKIHQGGNVQENNKNRKHAHFGEKDNICAISSISEKDNICEHLHFEQNSIVSEKDKRRIHDTIIQNDTSCEQLHDNNKVRDAVSLNNTAGSQSSNDIHVSFYANSGTSDDTEQEHFSELAISLGDHGRKMSQTPILEDLHEQAYGIKNPAFKLDHTESIQHDNRGQKKQAKSVKEKPKQRNITRKTTIIAFVVTLVFIISFVPHLCLQVAHIIYKGFDEKLEGDGLILYNTFLRSYFINSVANPIIYGVMNDKFRAEVKHALSRLRCW